MTGWASSAVSSVTGRGKKDKENFATLVDNDESTHDNGGLKQQSSLTSHSRSKSKDTMADVSPKIPIRIMKPPSLQGKKLVRALYDFTGSTDELAFNAGDEILVLNEVLDGWWMGELGGRKGLFPTSYTEVIRSSSSRLSASRRPDSMSTSLSSTDSSSMQSPVDGPSDLDESHLFSDPQVTIGRSPLYGNFDAESVTDSVVEEEEEKQLMPATPPSETDDDDHHYHIPNRSTSQPSLISRRSIPNFITTLATPTKKSPPPPPPRRFVGDILAPPPIPQRAPSAGRSGSLHASSPHSSSVSSLGHDVSPFDSATELPKISCQNFRQNPFKPPGVCSNCLQVHI